MPVEKYILIREDTLILRVLLRVYQGPASHALDALNNQGKFISTGRRLCPSVSTYMPERVLG